MRNVLFRGITSLFLMLSLNSLASAAISCSGPKATLTLNLPGSTVDYATVFSSGIIGTARVNATSNGMLVFFENSSNLLGNYPAGISGPTYPFQLSLAGSAPGSHKVIVAHLEGSQTFTDCILTYKVVNLTPPSVAQYPNQKPIWRFYGPSVNDHFLTASYGEGISDGRYYYEQVAFYTYNSPVDANSVLLYRCRHGVDHFVSVDSNCEGQVGEGSYGYVSSVPGEGLIPVYRFQYGDHLTTTNWNEGANYIYEGILGYVPAH